MSQKCSRRDFLKTAGAAGLSSVLASMAPLTNAASSEENNPKPEKKMIVPTRAFGKTGVNVSILSLGGMFDIPNNQLLLKQAIEWGVTYWDTADCYDESEKGIGKYLKKYPDARKKIFLVTKSDERKPDGINFLMNRSLERMNTDYIDIYFIHGLESIKELTNETKALAEKAKSEGKIKFFGFSTHKNMEECMIEAAKLGWIDAIMMSYNYRLMHTEEMKRAVDACVKAGIGLTAMKTQGGGSVSTESETEIKIAGRFLEKGFTDKQAKLKAVWENPYIASICSQMPNLTILSANVAAALDKRNLSANDIELFRQYAGETASDYCRGCSYICESAVGGEIPICDLMRYLMYYRSYGDKERAKMLFSKLPSDIRKNMVGIDYSLAEQKCPQKMAIGRLMKEAAETLA